VLVKGKNAKHTKVHHVVYSCGFRTLSLEDDAKRTFFFAARNWIFRKCPIFLFNAAPSNGSCMNVPLIAVMVAPCASR